MRPLRLGLIGWGAINRRVAELLSVRQPKRVEITAIGLRKNSTAAILPTATLLTRPEQLAGLSLDLVLEAASREAVAVWGEAALRNAASLVIASTSAFCDSDLLGRLIRVAEEQASQIILPGGALAGIEALSAAAVLPLDSVVHSIIKPPAAWVGTAAEGLVNLTGLTGAAAFFSGSAREVAALFPKNANVAVISALSGIGLDLTRVKLVADPGVTQNIHRLEVAGEFGRLEVQIENRPLAANPRSSEMTALSLVRIVENRVRALAC